MTTISRHISHLDFANETAIAKRRAAKTPLPGRHDKSAPNASANEVVGVPHHLRAHLRVFPVAAMLERLMPWRWLAQDTRRERHASVFREAWEAAGTCSAYAFMG